jgi:hypothetical protein
MRNGRLAAILPDARKSALLRMTEAPFRNPVNLRDLFRVPQGGNPRAGDGISA